MYILIVTGLSGAGKTHTLKKLEDMGYFCVDNITSSMLAGLIGVFQQAEPPIELIALGVDCRGSAGKPPFDAQALGSLPVKPEVLFLDCRSDVISRRFNETRRRHPLEGAGGIQAGIDAERELLQHIKDTATYLIDTTDLKPQELVHTLETTLHGGSAGKFSIDVMSFGFKRGVPFDADMVFDVRFMPNPFYEPSLRQLSGLDAPVHDYIFSSPYAEMFLQSVQQLIEKLLPGYIEQDKHRLTVAVGCTGGRHRSVCMANELYLRLKGNHHASITHRDFVSEAADLADRFHAEEE